MSSRSTSISDGEVLSGDEEKAFHTQASRVTDTKVNSSTRHLQESSSRDQRTMREIVSGPGGHFEGLPEEVIDELLGHGSKHKSRERSRSPYRRGKSRSRSPYRAPKGTVGEGSSGRGRQDGSGRSAGVENGKGAGGEKRRREDDHYTAKGSSDPRRFKVHYEDQPASREGPDGLSLGNVNDLETRHGDGRDATGHGRAGNGSHRDRSRSPFQPGKDANVTQREVSIHHTSSARESAKVKVPLSQQSQQQRRKLGDSHDIALSTSEETSANPAQTELSEAERIEQRRKRRAAIKAKHSSQPELLVQALEKKMQSAPQTPRGDSSGMMSEQQSPPTSMESPSTPQRDSPPESPAAISVDNIEDLANRAEGDSPPNEEEGPSAADYDPNMDLQEDRPDHKRSGVEAPLLNIPVDQEPPRNAQSVKKAPKEYDMFADDDDDDMFAPTGTKAAQPVATKQGKTLDESLLDNWDYPDGHYRIILGELLNDRYAVQQQIGKGTFATVVKAQDTETGQPVAIKIAANNVTMYKAGQKEMDFLKILNQNDPEDKRHIIRMLGHFDHKGHLCLVFEALNADLRETLKKFGRNIGIERRAIRKFAQQMFQSLAHMKKCQILHADLKPDNILVSEKGSTLKICDLGTASFANDAEVTPYLVSRFYRAPEVILGIPFDYAIDMWSIGCTLFELYTGRILFAGADNNQMLRVIQECRGKLPVRMLKRSTLADKHFDLDGNFFSQERDKLSGKTVIRQINFRDGVKGKDLKSRLAGNAKGLKQQEEIREHAAFVDLMERCLQLDPVKRISPAQALVHSFIMHQPAVGGDGKEKGKKIVPAMKAASLARVK